MTLNDPEWQFYVKFCFTVVEVQDLLIYFRTAPWWYLAMDGPVISSCRSTRSTVIVGRSTRHREKAGRSWSYDFVLCDELSILLTRCFLFQPVVHSRQRKISWKSNAIRVTIYRVVQIKRRHFSFLLVTNERIYKFLWFLPHIGLNYTAFLSTFLPLLDPRKSTPPRKPCCRKETARCRSCSFRLKSQYKFQRLRVTKLRKPGFRAPGIQAQNRI